MLAETAVIAFVADELTSKIEREEREIHAYSGARPLTPECMEYNEHPGSPSWRPP